jgi:hypothetical protein
MIEEARRQISRTQVRGGFRCVVARSHGGPKVQAEDHGWQRRQLADSHVRPRAAMGGGGAIRNPR